MPRPRDNKQVTMLEEVPTVHAHASHPAGASNGTITSIDLFAGAGGLSLGFHLAGFTNFANYRIRALLYAGNPTGRCSTPSLHPETRSAIKAR